MAPTLQRIKETRVRTATKRAPFTNLFAAFAPANDDNTWRGSHLNAPSGVRNRADTASRCPASPSDGGGLGRGSPGCDSQHPPHTTCSGHRR